MRLARSLFLAACIALTGYTGRAQDPAAFLFTLGTAGVARAEKAIEVRIDLVVLNTGSSAAQFSAPESLPGQLVIAGKPTPVVLKRVTDAAGETVQASGFARLTYRFECPADVTGRSILELDSPAVLRAVVDLPSTASSVAKSESAPTVPRASANGRPGLVPRVAASKIERTFRDHFEPHEPIYFIYGPKHPGAKFQLSFKYRVFGDSTSDEPETTRNSLQFAYTQRSLWDITANSSPFVDTSYMPELFYEHLAPEPEGEPLPFTWLGYQTGYMHESNGRDGSSSRSLNLLFVRPAIALGELGGWRMIFAPRIYGYILDMSDNPDLKKYRGYAEYRMVFGRNAGPDLAVSARFGTGWDHFTYQADLSYPLRLHSGGFASYLLIQYFDGYGESLIHYNDRSRSLRAGFSFVR